MQSKLEVLGVIPARGGSKRIQRKNIREIFGKPLIVYTIEEAKKSKCITRLVVSTEDEEIARISRECGVEVIQRDKEMAKDNIPVIPTLAKYIIEELERTENYCPDILVLLQPTSPLRKAEYIDKCINKLLNSKTDWVVTVSQVKTHPYKAKFMKKGVLKPLINNQKIWGQKQELPKMYFDNGAIKVIKTKNLKSSKGHKWNILHNQKFIGIEMPPEDSIDIDEEKDLLYLEYLLGRK